MSSGWRIVFLLSGLGNLGNALWMLADPYGWYVGLPAAVPDFGPYNEHFITDVGAAYLALTALAILALAWGDLRSCRLAGAGWAVFSAPHFLFHARHLDGLSSVDKVAELGTLGATLAAAIWLATPTREVDR